MTPENKAKLLTWVQEAKDELQDKKNEINRLNAEISELQNSKNELETIKTDKDILNQEKVKLEGDLKKAKGRGVLEKLIDDSGFASSDQIEELRTEVKTAREELESLLETRKAALEKEIKTLKEEQEKVKKLPFVDGPKLQNEITTVNNRVSDIVNMNKETFAAKAPWKGVFIVGALITDALLAITALVACFH